LKRRSRPAALVSPQIVCHACYLKIFWIELKFVEKLLQLESAINDHKHKISNYKPPIPTVTIAPAKPSVVTQAVRSSETRMFDSASDSEASEVMINYDEVSVDEPIERV
jgi:hypothetical protein